MTTPRVMVTGAAGFVGTHLVEALEANGFDTISTSKDLPRTPAIRPIAALDIVDAAAVSDMVKKVQPTHLIHLAAIPTVTGVSGDPLAAWSINVHGTLNVARAILKHAPRCVLVFAGSGEVYGNSVAARGMLDETTLLAPANEYAVTKAAADLALGALCNLHSIRFRPFNHAGPGQSEDFVIPAFAAQIARIEAGQQPPIIQVGNLEVTRDFLDVRDVVRAYALAVERSDDIQAGTIINLASGTPRRIRDILDFFLHRATKEIKVQTEPSRARANEPPVSVGSAARAKALLGWTPQIPFDETLLSVLAHWRGQIAA